MSLCISKALMILGYYEMSEEDQPDDSIWNHHERLEEWFDHVKSKYSKDAKQPDAEWESVDLEQNELTKGLR